MIPRRAPRAMVALLCALVSGCFGDIGGDAARPGGPVIPRDPSDPATAACALPSQGGRAPLHRLTHDEYDRSIAVLLGDTSEPASRTLPEEADANDDSRLFGAGLAEAYFNLAEDVAERAVADLPGLLDCDPSDVAGRDACAARFIDGFGRRAYRRPLESEERDALLGIYADAQTAWGFEDAIRLTLQSMLASPRFLYRVEMPASGPGPRALDDYELAARLSFELWGETPDDALLDAAERGELSTREGLETHARRLVEDTRADDTLVRYVGWWVELGRVDVMRRSAEDYPLFDSARTPERMRAETEAFIRELLRTGGNLREMLTAPWTMLDEHLATVYGIPGVTGDELRRVELDPDQRAGILTHASVMGALDTGTDIGRIIHRGLFVQARVLCGPPLSPPDGIPEPPPRDPDWSVRELLDAHQSDPYCASCHQFTDPFGFAFEHYDGVGAYLSSRDGAAVDASGELIVPDPATSAPVSQGRFEDAVDLAGLLAEREDVQACFARHWFRYSQRRRDTGVDACSIDQLSAALTRSDGDFREMLVAIALTDAFRLRAASEAP